MRFELFVLAAAMTLPAFPQQEPEGRQTFIDASLAYHHRSWDDCVNGYRLTVDQHLEVPFSKMMIARCFALKGDVENGIRALDEAAEYEFPNAQLLTTNEEFASLRGDARFAAVVAKVRENAKPCPNRSIRRQFDFWIGQWDVKSAAGQSIGSESIDASEDGCLLRESYTGPGGSTGKSFNYYDRLTGYWRQVWMDPSGSSADMYGGFINGSMELRQVTYNGGLKTIVTYTYTPQQDGTVRQLARRSIDDGETWTIVADYTYTRKTQ